MRQYRLNGIDVQFPFNAYPVQLDYMSHVIDCLNKKENGMLESPTGTGKTLSLLCSTLSWQQSQKAKRAAASNDADNHEFVEVPNIVYASRTHSQLKQALCELRRTSFSYVKAIIIGSRDQLCIHPKISVLENNLMKINLCSYKVKKRQCLYHRNVASKLEEYDLRSSRDDKNEKEQFLEKSVTLNSSFYETVSHNDDDDDDDDDVEKREKKRLKTTFDIEDLVDIGRGDKLNLKIGNRRQLSETADVIFLPYNYLVDPLIRSSNWISNKIIIFDEAHNLEKVCESSASIEITTSEMSKAIIEIDNYLQKMSEVNQLNGRMYDNKEIENVDKMIDIIETAKKCLTNMSSFLLDHEVDKEGSLLDISKFLQCCEHDCGVPKEKEMAIPYFADMLKLHEQISTSASQNNQRQSGAFFGKFLKFLEIFGMKIIPEYALDKNAYRIYLKNEEYFSDGKEISSRRLCFWCMTAKIGMKGMIQAAFEMPKEKNDGRSWKKKKVDEMIDMAEPSTTEMTSVKAVHSILITSGTLAPMELLEHELGVNFPIKLSGNHVIKHGQIAMYTTGLSTNGYEIIGTYKKIQENTNLYYKQIGESIMELICRIPHGILVFFPSYSMLDKMTEFWQKNGMWNRIHEIKYIFVEPKDKKILETTLLNYEHLCRSREKRGAIIFAVCRGKISEGIDFKDEGCRAVIVIGIPYPPIKDKHVAYKMDYMDKQNSQIQETSSKNSFHMSGQQWYQTQAMKAINQAIGRVIRHVNDYGCVILLDKRYEQTKNYENISQWMRHMSYTVNPNARHRIHRDIPFERICGSVKQFFFQMKELYDKKESCKRRLIDDSSTDIIDITTTTTTTMTPSKQKKSNMDEIRNKLIENKKNPIELNEVKSSKLHSDIIDYQARLDLIKKQKNERKIHIINKKNLSNIQTINENSQTYNNVTKEENNKKILEFRKKMLKHCSKSVRSSFHEKMINYRKSTTDEEENRKNRFELYEFLPKHFPKQMLNEFAIIIPKQYIDEFKHEILLTERRNDNDEVVTID